MPRLRHSRSEWDDVSSHGVSEQTNISLKRKEGSFMSSLKKLLMLQRQQRTADSASQLTQSRGQFWGSSQAASDGPGGGQSTGPPDGHEFSVRAPPRSSASMPLLFNGCPSLETPPTSILPSTRALPAGRRVPVAPSSSAVLQLPSIDVCTPQSSGGGLGERNDSSLPMPTANIRASSFVDARDKSIREQWNYNDIVPESHSPSQPLPQLRSRAAAAPAMAWTPSAEALVAASPSLIHMAPARALSPPAAAPSPTPPAVAVPTGAPRPAPLRGPSLSNVVVAASSPSPALPSPNSTLLAMCPGVPEAMRRPVWSLEDYSVTARVYKGEVSSVYKAVCLHSNTKVALKVYSLSRVAENAVHTLIREVRIHTELSHYSVLMLYGVFEEDNRLVLVLERASRGDLFHLHRSLPNCRMTEDQLRVLVLAPLLEALVYLHGKGVCHRDIKPENLLLTGSWQLKLADFGAAINLAHERAVTRTGTVDYMAPEVERCPLKAAPEDNKDNPDLAYTTAADVWSVGVLSFELLVGFPPFITGNCMNTGSDAVSAACDSEEARALHTPRHLSFPHFMSTGAQDFIAGALAERPGDRPTAVQLLRHPWLKHALRQHYARLQQQQQQQQLQQQQLQPLQQQPGPQQPAQVVLQRRPPPQQHSSQQLIPPRQLSQQLPSTGPSRQASQLRSLVPPQQAQSYEPDPGARLLRQGAAPSRRASWTRGPASQFGAPQMSPIAAAAPQ